MSQETLLIIDGSSYLYRAYHALPKLINTWGEPTGALYGVVSMLRRSLAEYKPHYAVVVFDAKGKNFRHALYPEYKANRPPMPDDLQQQIEPLFETIRAMHIPLISIEGIEADDIIGTLAKQGEQSGLSIIVSTGDKDLAQLVNDQITLVNTMSDSVLDKAGVLKKFGVNPDQIIDYLSLVGDTVDNIKGVDKVGPKTAVQWLSRYGSLEAIIKHADEITGKVGENLRAALDYLPLTQKLVTVQTELDLPYHISDVILGEPDEQRLKELFVRYEFKSWIKELGGPKEKSASSQKTYQKITSDEALNDLINKLNHAEKIVLDTETTSLNYMQAKLVGISFALSKEDAMYIPLAHTGLQLDEQQLDFDKTLHALKPILENPKIKKIGHHIKYDMEILARYDIYLQGVAYDTMLESYVVDSIASRHDMDSLSEKYLHHKTIKFEEIAGKGAKQITFDQVALDIATQYAAEDAAVTWQLHDYFWPKISKEAKLQTIFETIEMPLVPVLMRVERNGVLINKELLTQQSHELEKRANELQNKIFEISGHEFNVNSPKQLQQVLYDELKLPVIKKTPTGLPSTNEAVLQDLSFQHECPQLILEYRSLVKLKSTYTDRLPERIDPDTGRVHTSYHQAVAGTGRLSSSDPNLQNIPIRTQAGRNIRKAFIASEGSCIVAADYSQIELRIMAHISGDKGLIDAFLNDQDVHRATAAQVFGVDIHEVTADQRRKAKAINFGLMYGMSAFGLAKQLQVDRSAAQTYIDAYFEQYPQVAQYMEAIRKQAHELGYVETIFGRRLYLPEINSRQVQRQKASERAAINAPMQGTAADIIKRAMIQVDAWLQESDVNALMIMQVHDELVFEVPIAEKDELIEHVSRIMSQAAHLSVPLVVDVGVGNNWDEAH